MRIREYIKGDEKDIIKLDKILEEHPWNRRNLKNWSWKYKGQNPFGKSLIFVATDKKNIIASFSIIPLNYFINKKIFKGACSIAMMVHPKYQNSGLIKFVADKLFEKAKKNGIDFVYGYPNLRSYAIHKKLFNYNDINNQEMYYLNIKKEIFFEKEIFQVKSGKFLNDVNKLIKVFSNHHNVVLNKNKQFLNWRYYSRPDYKYKIFQFMKNERLVGYTILKIYRENAVLRGHIIDIIYDPKYKKNLLNYILNFSYNFFRLKKCSEISLWAQGDNYLRKILKYHNYKIKSKRPLICKNLSLNPNYLKYLNKKDWFFTMGDTLEIY